MSVVCVCVFSVLGDGTEMLCILVLGDGTVVHWVMVLKVLCNLVLGDGTVCALGDGARELVEVNVRDGVVV